MVFFEENIHSGYCKLVFHIWKIPTNVTQGFMLKKTLPPYICQLSAFNHLKANPTK